jgi:hypothetical protein
VALGSDTPNNNGMNKTQGTGFTPATAAMKITNQAKQSPQTSRNLFSAPVS